jgi:diacylglycerol O-acyltransferase
VRLFSKRATLMVSVVRGPVNTIRLAGARVRDVMVWAPVPGTIAVGITMMSYAGRVRLGLNADALVVRDPERLLSCILRELED